MWIRIAAAVGALATAGCMFGGARVDRSTFFALAATERTDGDPTRSPDVSIGLGPVAIPVYLDRSELVTRVGPNELRLARAARWAEPLREGLVRTLRQDLVVASGVRQVLVYPWPPASPMDFAVMVDIQRFEPSATGTVDLVARWTLHRGAHGRVVAARESHLTERVEGVGAAADVAGLSRALGALAREIAAALPASTD